MNNNQRIIEKIVKNLYILLIIILYIYLHPKSLIGNSSFNTFFTLTQSGLSS